MNFGKLLAVLGVAACLVAIAYPEMKTNEAAVIPSVTKTTITLPPLSTDLSTAAKPDCPCPKGGDCVCKGDCCCDVLTLTPLRESDLATTPLKSAVPIVHVAQIAHSAEEAEQQRRERYQRGESADQPSPPPAAAPQTVNGPDVPIEINAPGVKARQVVENGRVVKIVIEPISTPMPAPSPPATNQAPAAYSYAPAGAYGGYYSQPMYYQTFQSYRRNGGGVPVVRRLRGIFGGGCRRGGCG